MTLGIFAGTGMDVKAADEYEIELIGEPNNLDEIKRIRVSDADLSELDNAVGTMMSSLSPNKKIVIGGRLNYMDGVLFYVQEPPSNIVNYVPIYYDVGNENVCLDFYKNNGFTWYLLKKKVASPDNTSNSEASTSISSSFEPHTHSYSWVTVQEANVGQDEIEEYRCSCGDVQGRSIIPASEAAVKGLFGEIKNAPQNGTATFDSGRLYTISDYVIKKLAEQTDVTTVITFEYQNQAYMMTIPAGADFTGLLADEDYFYGYYFFANAVGATIEAI